MKTLTEILEENYSPITNLDERYDNFLDCDGPVTVVGLEYYPSRILREVDPIAYRCGYDDFIDSEDIIEHDGEYYSQSDYDEAEQELEDQEESL